MRVRHVALLGLIVSLVAIVGLSIVISPTDDFVLENPFWNGFSEVDKSLRPISITNFEALSDKSVDYSRSILLIVGPSKSFSEQDAETVKAFLSGGGHVVLADDFGTGNDLVAKLGLNIRFSGFILRDPLFMDKSSALPRTLNFESSSYTANISSLALNYATSLTSLDSGFKVLAYSSAFSYLDENGNGKPDKNEVVGPFPLIAELRYGEGNLIIISDSSIFINSMINNADNRIFLIDLVGNRTVYLDRFHWIPGFFTQFKWALTQIYMFISTAEVKYTLLVTVLVLTFSFSGWSRRIEEVDELKTISKVHPEWNKEILTKLKEQRDTLGNQ